MGEAVSGVHVLSVSRVAPSPADHACHVKVKLSFLDMQWVATPPFQKVFLYQLSGGNEFSAAVTRLKESLAATLALYLPLAGKLAYVAETGEVVVDCSDTGVAFFEAEAKDESRMDVRRLASDEAHHVAAFLSLVPQHDARVLPAPVLCLQATRLGGGLALGLSVHHAVADGCAMAKFMNAWASASRGDSPTSKSLSPPQYSREAVVRAHPRGDELAREVLKKVAPNLPVANASEDYFTQRSRLARRTFYLNSDDVRSLKRRIDSLAPCGEAAKPVSTFVALSALGWTAFVRAKRLAPGDDTYLAFPADLRARLHLAVGEGYFGNCVRVCVAIANVGELLGEAGLLHASCALQAAVREMEAAPLVESVGWVEWVRQLPLARLVWVVGSPLFRVYDTADLGFRRPVRVEPVSMNHDGRMLLAAGRRDGEMQVSVSLDPGHMDAFKAHFFNSSRPKPKM